MKHSERHLVRVTVSVVAHLNGRVLLIKEPAAKGKNKVKSNPICEPVGHLDPDEHIVHGAEREFYEETGYRVKLTGLTGVCHTFFRAPGSIDSIRFAFRGRIVGGHPRLRKEKDITPFFVSRAELKRILPQLRYASKRAVAGYLKGVRMPIRHIQTLVKH